MRLRRHRRSTDEDPLVFAGSGSPRLTAAICRELGIAVAAGEVIRFSEGTLFVRVLENVRGRSVYPRAVDSLSDECELHGASVLDRCVLAGERGIGHGRRAV